MIIQSFDSPISFYVGINASSVWRYSGSSGESKTPSLLPHYHTHTHTQVF